MSIKEIKEAMDNGKVCFGFRQAVRNSKNSKKAFVVKDVRVETIEKLKTAGVEPNFLKQKSEVVKELNLDFDCEVYCII